MTLSKTLLSLGLGLACVPFFATAAGAAPPVMPAETRATLSKAIAADHDEALSRLREWIALPSINAEKLNRQEGAELMQRMLLDAGFDTARIIPTDGAPGVFGRLDAGASTTLAVYFMYDVKQFEAHEWSQPPLEGRLVEREGKTVLIGRGAINQKGPEATLLTAIRC